VLFQIRIRSFGILLDTTMGLLESLSEFPGTDLRCLLKRGDGDISQADSTQLRRPCSKSSTNGSSVVCDLTFWVSPLCAHTVIFLTRRRCLQARCLCPDAQWEWLPAHHVRQEYLHRVSTFSLVS
jgi:hypothetical protein